MNNSETKSLLVGHLLDVIKYAADENEKFERVGVHINTFSYMESKVWESVKCIVGMPEVEVLGVFISDIWSDYAFAYVNGELSKEEAINYIINWNSNFGLLN